MNFAPDMLEAAAARSAAPRRPRPTEPLRSAPVLRPGRNVWRQEEAGRAAVLVDGGSYFGALRAAMLQAKETIHIAGWDLDSRMKLVGTSGTAEDGLPETLAAFLSALVARNPRLRIRLLLWDYSVMFAFERELAPIYSFLWATPRQIELCLDDALPIGASHHQKIVVIDDRIAFSGGLDLTGRRWDTRAHMPDDPRRLDAAGAAYEPFHDVQMAVDGAAAAALGRLFRARWKRAACERLPVVRHRIRTDRWPKGLEPDFRAVDIGIARTLPPYDGETDVREVEALFSDMVDVAERHLYVENQFLTCERFTARLIARIRERPELEALLVTPRDYHGWFENQAMGAGRARMLARLAEAGLMGRVRMVFPEVEADGATAAVMVHSKVMIVDDHLLRIGSANLCNRSMGFDSECDLVIEASDDKERAGIAAVRNRMLGEHVGLEADAVAEIIARTGSLLAVLGEATSGRRLLDVPRSAPSDLPLPSIDALADPLEPIYEERSPARGNRSWARRLLPLGIGVVLLAALVFAWANSPFSEPERLITAFDAVAERPWAPAAVVAIYVLGGLVVFPVSVLIVATVAVFGGWTGAVLAGVGALASAIVTYLVGRKLGAGVIRRFIGPRINRIRRGLASQGIVTVATVRLVPVAPFTFVNLVAGAAGVRLLDYVVGTALGLMPGLIVLTALGRQIVDMVTQPSLASAGLLAGFVLLWVLCSLGLQLLVSHFRRAG